MRNIVFRASSKRRLWRHSSTLLLLAALLAAAGAGPVSSQNPVQFDPGIDPAAWYQEHEVEHTWRPDYLHLATGDPLSTDHGVYDWPFALDSIGWNIQSYQYYGGTPYFHHGLDMMKVNGTDVFNRSGGQVINIENYRPPSDLYWEVAILDPDGYIWQYHHIDHNTIPQSIWDKYYEYLADPVNGGFIPANTYIGDIVYWPVWSFGKQFNHIHLNILGAGGVYMNGFEFHTALPDTDGPEILTVGLLQNGQIYPGNEVDGDYSLYVHARDLVLDGVYYLPPFEFTFSVDGGPEQTTWRFDTLPGGADDTAYLQDFYVVPPTCGDYSCRQFYVDLGFIPDSQYEFPCSGGQHMVLVTVRDYAGNAASQLYTYTVTNHPPLAHPQSVITDEDTPAEILLTGSDQNCDLLTFTVVTDPQHGALGGIAPNLTYTPTADYYGPDAFTFVVGDGLATSDPAPVSITVQAVNDAPVAGSQALSTDEDMPLAITLTGSDAEGDLLTFGVMEGPGQGTLGGIPPHLTYTPTADYYGPDAFTFVVSDGLATSNPAPVRITVQAVNDAPVANPQAVTTTRGRAVPITLTGSDVEGDALSYSVVTDPAHGTLAGAAPYLTYTPAPGYGGSDSFTFIVNDGELDSGPATVSIAIRTVLYLPLVIKP